MKTSGEDIWYGVFATQMSKYGRSNLRKSPCISWSFFAYSLHRMATVAEALVHAMSPSARMAGLHAPIAPGGRYVPWTRLVNSPTIRASYSIAITFFAFSSNFIVRFPEPGPISRTMSVDLTPACPPTNWQLRPRATKSKCPVGRRTFSTIASMTSGFFKKCWPYDLSARVGAPLLVAGIARVGQAAHLVPSPGTGWSPSPSLLSACGGLH